MALHQQPEALAPLWQPARYKAAYGGRGGAKSHFFAEMLVLRCYEKTTRAVCIREVQLSLKESVRQLLIDKIAKFGLESYFDVTENEIRGKHNGSLIVFKGMQAFNADNIKSYEGYDIAWVEEAQTLSGTSLRLLRPTIRKEYEDGTVSEIWFSWNPRYDTDPVDKFFRGGKPHKDTIIVNVNWADNKWFPKVLRDEMEHDYASDPDMADHVWAGGYENIVEGAYYARDIAKCASDGRIGFFSHDPSLPVMTAWDIGVDDYTAIWFLQQQGIKVRAIDFYEASGLGIQQIVEDALPELMPDVTKAAMQLFAIGRDEPYVYGEHWFPHDVAVREWGGGAKSRIQTITELGFKSIRKGVSCDPGDRINATRRLLPHMEFNQGPDPDRGINLGLAHLKKYKRRTNEAMARLVGKSVYGEPLKDGNDHAADALGEFAVNYFMNLPKPPEQEKPKPGLWQIEQPPIHEPTGMRIRV